jgi:hypothetical protein
VSGYVLAGLGLGLVLTLAHIIVCIRRGRRPALESAVVLIISAVGLGTAGKVLKICITADDLEPFANKDRVYIFLGGVALLWVSVEAIWNRFR